MKYSRFNEQTGMYDVFQDNRTHALNGDLPVPKLGPSVNGIGVPARLAGRSLPAGAKPVGSSWEPVGMLVTPSGAGGLSAFDPQAVTDTGWLVGGAVAGGLLGSLKDNTLGGILTGLVVGGVGIYLSRKQTL